MLRYSTDLPDLKIGVNGLEFFQPTIGGLVKNIGLYLLKWTCTCRVFIFHALTFSYISCHVTSCPFKNDLPIFCWKYRKVYLYFKKRGFKKLYIKLKAKRKCLFSSCLFSITYLHNVRQNAKKWLIFKKPKFKL